MKSRQSVVVDNTHVDVEARKKFVDVAKSFPCVKSIRCFVMSATPEHARHNNLFRELTGSAGQHAKIKEPLFHAYK